METINHLNQQLHDCQRQYTDLLTTKSMDTFSQTDIKKQLTRMTEDKEKLEHTCEDLQVLFNYRELSTVRNRNLKFCRIHRSFLLSTLSFEGVNNLAQGKGKHLVSTQLQSAFMSYILIRVFINQSVSLKHVLIGFNYSSFTDRAWTSLTVGRCST
jgi:hypothetical protein